MPPFNSIEVHCTHCGASLLRQSYRFSPGRNYFCNNSCKAAWQKSWGTKEYSCAYCGTKFMSNQKRKYCCHACYGKASQVGEQRTCEHCGKTYTGRGERNLHFCSRACYRSVHNLPVRQYTCLCCGKRFDRATRSDRPPKYCCAKCRNSHLKPPKTDPNPLKTHICETCGKEFQGLRHIKRKYCSQTCFGLAIRGTFTRNTVIAPCQQCGTEMEYYPGNPRKFCSYACYARWQSENLSGENSYNWQGGAVDYRGPNWDEQAQKARKRDGYWCRLCAITEDELGHRLDVHHLIPFRQFGIERYEEANSLDNLISLCRNCHVRVEKGTLSAKSPSAY